MPQHVSGIRELLNDEAARVLPEGVTVDAIATGCREALLQIMAGTDWGKTELAMWLAGPYRHVTSFSGQRREQAGPETLRPPARVLKSVVRVDAVEELVRTTRERVLVALRGSAPTQAEVAAAHYSGFVARCRDEAGHAGWMPVDWSGMGLYDRVISLAVADYLVRPADYLGLMSICRVCGALSFDAQCRAQDVCRLHMPSVRRIALR